MSSFIYPCCKLLFAFQINILTLQKKMSICSHYQTEVIKFGKLAQLNLKDEFVEVSEDNEMALTQTMRYYQNKSVIF